MLDNQLFFFSLSQKATFKAFIKGCNTFQKIDMDCINWGVNEWKLNYKNRGIYAAIQPTVV